MGPRSETVGLTAYLLSTPTAGLAAQNERTPPPCSGTPHHRDPQDLPRPRRRRQHRAGSVLAACRHLRRRRHPHDLGDRAPRPPRSGRGVLERLAPADSAQTVPHVRHAVRDRWARSCLTTSGPTTTRPMTTRRATPSTRPSPRRRRSWWCGGARRRRTRRFRSPTGWALADGRIAGTLALAGPHSWLSAAAIQDELADVLRSQLGGPVELRPAQDDETERRGAAGSSWASRRRRRPVVAVRLGRRRRRDSGITRPRPVGHRSRRATPERSSGCR